MTKISPFLDFLCYSLLATRLTRKGHPDQSLVLYPAEPLLNV